LSSILVTGGSGYIGSHTVLALQRAGYLVVLLEHLGYRQKDLPELVLKMKPVIGDITSLPFLQHVFTTHNIAAVMHFAAYSSVAEAVSNPAKYYRNNVIGTLTLLEAMLSAGVKRFVFSSSSSIYDISKNILITEESSQSPINPYGHSKLMAERIISDFETAYNFKSVIFRYFNAAGADPNGLIGEDHQPETHLFPLLLLTALGKRESISVFGTDYPTVDGTCIRDYVHVCDIAEANLLGLQHLLSDGNSLVLNVSSGKGFSVKQVIEAARQVTKKDLKIEYKERRKNDPPFVVGSSEKVRRLLGWSPKYPDLMEMMEHAWQWHQKRHGDSF
jgi:UDP-glucose 4-epimerase